LAPSHKVAKRFVPPFSFFSGAAEINLGPFLAIQREIAETPPPLSDLSFTMLVLRKILLFAHFFSLPAIADESSPPPSLRPIHGKEPLTVTFVG